MQVLDATISGRINIRRKKNPFRENEIKRDNGRVLRTLFFLTLFLVLAGEGVKHAFWYLIGLIAQKPKKLNDRPANGL